MNTQQMIDAILSYQDILASRGVAFKASSRDELASKDDHELAQLLRLVRDLARTPST